MMARTATITGRILSWSVQNVQHRRVLRLVVQFRILDGLQQFNTLVQQRYPFAAFSGASTPQQVLAVIRDQGYGDIPPMRDVAQELLQRWDLLAVVRSIPLPVDLGTLEAR